MSKKNKVSSVKAKGSSKKVTKVVKAKPKAKAKAAPKKAKPAPKKAVKKAVKAKPAPKKKLVVKKASPKKPVKKITKPVKQVKAKPASKPKVAAKPIKKKVAPKKAIKPVVKKAAVKTVKKAEVKKKEVKAVAKVVAKKAEPAKPLKLNVPEKKTVTKKPAESEDVDFATPKADVKKKPEEKKDEVLAIMNTIPKAEVQELSASRIASITSSITNPVKKTGSYAVKSEKEPNGKFEMEFVVRSSPEMLYEFLSTASGLSEWFCDDVNIRNGIYTFIWDGQMQQARLLKTIDNQLARYQWVDKTDGSYFEFRIQRDDLTNDISLIITDFAETKADQESSKLLWNSQVEKLMHVIGSIF